MFMFGSGLDIPVPSAEARREGEGVAVRRDALRMSSYYFSKYDHGSI